jgi:hypothetical protein
VHLDEARRGQRGLQWRRRLRLPGRRALLDPGRCPFAEDVPAGQYHPTLLGQALDELPADHLFDRTRRALDLDAMVTLEQRDNLLARGPEQLRDFVYPNGGQR